MPGVAEVIPILKSFKLASREWKPEGTIIEAGSATIGGQALAVIAGPCSVESEAQLMETAHAVKAAGATALRAGAFKPAPRPTASVVSARKASNCWRKRARKPASPS